MNQDLLDLGVKELGDLIARREVTAVEAAQTCLEALERADKVINCVIHLEPEQALRMAESADKELEAGKRRGPLHGVPMAHKDIFYRKGCLTTAGSKITKDFRPDYTGWVLEKLDAAGAVDLGGLNTVEFCVGPTGHNDYFGHCRNPWDPDKITGGSSSGSGAATAARAVPAAMGSDTGASIRAPAGICGVTGLKPTHGRVSLYGATRRCWSLDCFGPLARSALDVALVFQPIAGHDPRDPLCRAEPVPDYVAALAAPVRGLRIGVPRNHLMPDLDQALMPIHQEALAAFKALGCEVVEIDIPDPHDLYERTVVINKVEATSVHEEWIRTRRADYNLSTISRIAEGFDIPAIDYIKALDGQAQARARFDREVFSKVDALYTTLLLSDTPTIEETDIRRAEDAARIVQGVTKATRWVNYVGLPALAFPCGFSATTMPVAAQLVGPAFTEDRLLGLVHHFQQGTDWHERKPRLHAGAH